MPPQLTQTQQIGFKQEGSPGVEATLAADDFVGVNKDNQFGHQVSKYDQQPSRATLTKFKKLPGSRMGTLSMTHQLYGGTASTAARWHQLLQAMGFQSNTIKRVRLGGAANAAELRIGQTIGDNQVEGSATKTGEFVYYDPANLDLYYLPVTGTFADQETIYNYTATQFSGDISGAPNDAGAELRPLTPEAANQHDTLTVEEVKGGYVNRIIGARGGGSLRVAMDEPLTITAEMRGPTKTGASGAAIPKAFVAGVAIPSTPKVVKGTTLSFRESGQSSDWTPVLAEVTFDLGNTIADRKTLGGEEVEDSGYAVPNITNREPTVTIDPEADLSSFDLQAMMRNGTTFEVLAEVGTPADTNGMIIVWAPAADTPEDLEDADRDGIQTYGFTCPLTGDDDDEIRIFHLFD